MLVRQAEVGRLQQYQVAALVAELKAGCLQQMAAFFGEITLSPHLAHQS